MPDVSGALSRRVVVLLAIGGVAAVVGVVVGVSFVLQAVLAPPPPVEAKPGQAIFEALRLTDADVAYLGLKASTSGHTPSTLATAATRVASDWRDAKGTPDECMFAGPYPADSVYPVWGTETSADPLWKEKTVSATQTLTSAGQSFITLTSRTFVDDQAALDFLLGHNDAVPACPSFTVAVFQGQSTTTLTPLLVDTLQVSNTGWVANTAGWAGTQVQVAPVDVQCWVLNMQHGNTVERMTMLVTAEEEAQAGPFFTELASVVANKLAMTVKD